MTRSYGLMGSNNYKPRSDNTVWHCIKTKMEKSQVDDIMEKYSHLYKRIALLESDGNCIHATILKEVE